MEAIARHAVRIRVDVSIVVPVFNEAAALPAFIDAAGTLGAEVLFVDGGSTDQTIEILESRGLRHLSAPRGRGPQMNTGAKATTGDILLFLHADSRLPPGALAAVENAVSSGAVGGYFEVSVDSGRPLLRLVARLITWKSRLTRVASGDQAIFLTRDAFEELGGYANVPLFEDLDLSRRLKRRGRVVSLRPPVVTSARRWDRLGVGRTILRMWALRTLYYCGVSPERLARHYETAR